MSYWEEPLLAASERNLRPSTPLGFPTVLAEELQRFVAALDVALQAKGHGISLGSSATTRHCLLWLLSHHGPSPISSPIAHVCLHRLGGALKGQTHASCKAGVIA